MSVINTNYLALVSQNNLVKSQNALGTAIERLSSGMRINSAKDDAAGQAIANRFTANIKGLTQAARNANDGISIAQTTEGALNEINNNLQRIRELSVQAANGSNSGSDLKSIQAEIQQRLDEIDRVSDQTQFNGVKVLAQKNSLTVQVGAHDNETISVNLRQINASTLGLGSYDVQGAVTSKSLTNVTAGGTADKLETATIQANSYTPTNPGGPNGPVMNSDGLYETNTGFAVKGEDGNFYELTHNPNTDKWVWDSSTAALDVADVKVAQGPVTELPVNQIFDATDTTWDDGTGAAGTAVTETGAAAAGFSIDYSKGLFERNDIVNSNPGELGTPGSALYAVEGSDGNYYEIEATLTFNGIAGEEGDQTKYSVTFDIDLDPASLVQISPDNIVGAVSNIQVGENTITPEDDLLNEAINPAITSAGLFAMTSGEGYVVEGTDGKYYAATVAANGDISWDSGTDAIDAAEVNVAGGAVTQVVVGEQTGGITGLGVGETLHSYEDNEGNTQYLVKGGTATEPTYTKATLGDPDAVTGDRAVTKETGVDAQLTVNPLEALDVALAQVDSLRSELGAIQNRFQSTIANLTNTVNNLSAARSRIEDADYAVEVSNMTRAQILQQAGTSVLAQANQIPQTVLSLLR